MHGLEEGGGGGVFTYHAEILWAFELRSEMKKKNSQCSVILQVLNKS